MPHCSAASMAFASIRSRFTRLDLAVLGQHRRHPRHAHLGRLLDHVVEAGLLERGEEVAEVRRRRLGAHLFADVEGMAPPALGGERRAEFAVASVEDEEGIAVPETEHVDEVVGLRAVELDPRAGCKHAADEQPLQFRIRLPCPPIGLPDRHRKAQKKARHEGGPV